MCEYIDLMIELLMPDAKDFEFKSTMSPWRDIKIYVDKKNSNLSLCLSF